MGFFDGSIKRYKVRLMAKELEQCLGIDYHNTFSPVVQQTAVMIVLSLALAHGCSFHKLGINNNFLHRTLSEDVHMTQPLGFKIPHFLAHVCMLRKAIYGLK